MTNRDSLPIVPSNWEFDASGFARVVTEARLSRGWSTRELARRAGISQPYVVALERARGADAPRTPTPAIDVVARLADALGFGLAGLASAALRRSSRHVVLVLDGDHRHPLSHVRELTGDDDSEWVWASSGSADLPRHAAHRIDLRRDTGREYRPADIARSLHRELTAIANEVDGRRLGLVFPETSEVMASLDDPSTILDFERGWGDEVARATEAAGGHAVWNVCIYDIGALRGLDQPVDATLELIRNHDTIWSAGRSHHAAGAAAASHVLQRLRPAGTGTSDWSAHVRQLVESLDLAA
jgi:transcriptional regulator with XRE-family HTH domain